LKKIFLSVEKQTYIALNYLFSQECHLGYPTPYLFKTKTCKISLLKTT